MRQEFLEIFILTAASTLIYLKSLSNGHTMDDHPGIEWNPVVLGRKPWSSVLETDFWGQNLDTDASHGSFRPLVTAMYRLQAVATAWYHGDIRAEKSPSPTLLHFVNILCHFLSSCALYVAINEYLAWSKIPECFNVTVSFVASLLFALHPIHAEAVCGGVGQAEVVCSFFMFTALFFYLKTMKTSTTNSINIFLVLSLTILACSSKEQGFMLLPMCFILEMIHFGRSEFKLTRALTCLVATFALGYVRIHFFGSPKSSLFLHFDNPAAFQPFPIRHLTYLYLPVLNLWQLLYPFSLSADWGDGAIALVKSPADLRFWLAIFAYAAVVKKTWKAGRQQIFRLFRMKNISAKSNDNQFLVSLAIFGALFVPSSNLFGTVGFVMAERVLYAPSAGFCLLVAIGFQRIAKLSTKIAKDLHKVLVICAAGTLLAFACRTVLRSFDWQSDMELSYASLRTTQTNARIHINVGAYIRETSNDCHRALAYFTKAVQLNPRMAKAAFNRARCMRHLIETRPDEAAALKRNDRSVKRPKGEPSLKQLAAACDASLRHCIAVAKYNIPPNGFVPNHLVECHLDLVNLMTVHGELYLGSKAQTQAVADEAMMLLEKARKMRPDMTRIHISEANLLMTMKNFKKAKVVLESARKMGPPNPEVQRALGWIYAEQDHDDQSAVNMYHEALQMKHDFEEAAVELSKILLRGKYTHLYDVALKHISDLPQHLQSKEQIVFLKAELSKK